MLREGGGVGGWPRRQHDRGRAHAGPDWPDWGCAVDAGYRACTLTIDEQPTTLELDHLLLDINGTKHPLQPQGLVVGRGTEADVRINDPGVSRRHVEFEVDLSGGLLRLSVRDLGSTNGMLVDGHRITHTRVHDRSTVKIGNTTMTVRVIEEGADV